MTKQWRLFYVFALFVNGYLIVAQVEEFIDIKFPRRFGRCVLDNGLLVLQQMDVHQCVVECSIRKACLSISYRRARHECKLLNTTTVAGSTAILYYSSYPCMNVNKYDVIDLNGNLAVCEYCDVGMTCNVSSGGCYYSECPLLTVTDADVQCHVTYVGAAASISCLNDNSGVLTNIHSVCQLNGSWSNVPTCPTSSSSIQLCSTSFEMVTGSESISDSKITASSEYAYYAAKYSRLRNSRAWAAEINSTGEYIQFDFTTERIVTAVQTQGRCCPDEWVTAYVVKTSRDCNQFHAVLYTSNGNQIFPGNEDPDSVVENYLYYPTIARCVRIHPQTWYDWITMRVEIIGCHV